jgi:hypothetical protein
MGRYFSGRFRNFVDKLNATERARQFTLTEVSDLQDRGVISAPAQLGDGTWPPYPEKALAAVRAVAKELNEKRDTNRAIRVAFVGDAPIDEEGVRRAYEEDLRGLIPKGISEKRIRPPTGLFVGPIGSLTKRAVVNAVNGTRLTSGAMDDLIRVLGLPTDLRRTPQVPSPIDHPTLEELLSSVCIESLLVKIRKVRLAELRWAAQSMLTLLQYMVVLYRIASMTGSSGPPIDSDDPKVVGDARHVFRTLTAGGKFLDRMIKMGGKRTEIIDMAARGAPVLLVFFDVWPDARHTYELLMEQPTRDLPRLQAFESLIKDVPDDRRHLLRWESLPLVTSSRPDELEHLRAIARAWSERNPDEAASLVMQPAIDRKQDEAPKNGPTGDQALPA